MPVASHPVFLLLFKNPRRARVTSQSPLPIRHPGLLANFSSCFFHLMYAQTRQPHRSPRPQNHKASSGVRAHMGTRRQRSPEAFCMLPATDTCCRPDHSFPQEPGFLCSLVSRWLLQGGGGRKPPPWESLARHAGLSAAASICGPGRHGRPESPLGPARHE